ncbi:TNT domain-containing protein [Actinophytocola sp.]|uniref:TNT domain-containing protein n=1 Tax=Actinophytocola sp. TaxID=1872138 RepID=UPI002D320FA1|nr:TNT domain-containing protein [Actinophytocola sp.]HYQ70189.1 TNT domain-containing protein [Actinophytocola sp.]
MTRPAPLGFEEQRELQRKIADLLALRAPSDRDQIRVVYRGCGNNEEIIGQIIGIDGQLRDWEAPRELGEFYRRLRAGMYREGAGTWSAASTVVEWPIRLSINYLFPEDPRWRQPPSRYDVLDELEMYPRAPSSVPDWMKTILPNAERVAEVAGRFRQARIFDHREPNGRPVVNRPPVPESDLAGVLNYLNTAHVIMGGRGFDVDLFDPNGARDTPAAFHTDGTWIWPAAIPHYLAKHGVPPEADLVEHIRANGFTPPQLEREPKDAAYIALTGELPAPPQPDAQPPAAQPEPAQQPAAQPEPAQPPAAEPPGRQDQPQVTPPGEAELSDRDRRVLAIIDRRASEAGALPEAYRILGSAEGAVCLERVDDEWQVADYERGQPRNPKRFGQLWDAGAYLLGSLTVTPGRLRAGGSDVNTSQALNDWPIQPLPGEPPLTLVADKHIAVLMPGREIVRYGSPAGNLTFAADTEFSAMSLRAEREELGPRRYRVVRELRTLSGRTVPWHNQPGGGTAYLLPRSVEEHLANGSIAEA